MNGLSQPLCLGLASLSIGKEQVIYLTHKLFCQSLDSQFLKNRIVICYATCFRSFQCCCAYSFTKLCFYTRTSMCDHRPKATAHPKHQTFPSQSLTVGTSSKRPPRVSDRDYFLSLTVNDFPLLTSCKRPLDSFSNLYFRCVHYVT